MSVRGFPERPDVTKQSDAAHHAAGEYTGSSIDLAAGGRGFLAAWAGRIGIRVRLMAVIALAILPLMFLIVDNIRSDFRETIQITRAKVQAAAELTATLQSRVFLETRVFIDTLRFTSATLLKDGAGCGATLARLRAAEPQFNGIGIVDKEGTVRCHSSLPTPRPYANSVVFQKTMAAAPDAFVVGNFTLGAATGRPTLTMAMPIPSADGAGMVFVGFDLEKLLWTGEKVANASRSVVSMYDLGSGRFITKDSAGATRLTSDLRSHPLARAIASASGPGVVDAVGLDGVERIYGFAPLPGASSFVLSVGVSASEALAPVYARSIGSILTALAVSFLTCLAAWWLGAWTHLRPLGKLGDMARKVGIGDLGARVVIDLWQAPEFRRLGIKLNRMAERLMDVRKTEQAAAEQDAIYKLLTENTADVVVRLDPAGALTFVSPAARDVLGSNPEDLLGIRPEAIGIAEDQSIVASMVGDLQAGQPVSDVRFRVCHSEEREVWIEVSAAPLAGGGGVLVMRDVTKRKAMEEALQDANSRLEVLAFNDALTGLANRRGFDQRFDVEFKRALREGGDLSLILFDIDRFKKYNDTYGHPAGDECLRLVAEAFRRNLRRPGDIGARYGGEEFIAILPNTAHDGAADRAEAIRLAIRSIGLEHSASEFGIVTASLGVVTMSGAAGYDDAASMLVAVDRALYRAKSGGRDNVRGASQEAPV
jgi:diguanylate cyclase (GGDEF)-like protein/PAS domain S-box-containing protein